MSITVLQPTVQIKPSSIPLSVSPRHFDALDGFRLVAILAIIFYHSNNLFGFSPPILVNRAGVLVTYFFVLSGFVLSHQYACFTNVPQYFRYLGSRFARIGPACLFTLLLSVVLNPNPVFDKTKFLPSLLANLFLVQSWFSDPNFYLGFNAPSWTLSVDAFLYLLLPLALVLNQRQLTAGALAVTSLSGVVAIVFFHVGVGWAFSMLPLSRVFDFALGVAAYRVIKANHYSLSSNCSSIIEFLFLAFWTVLCVLLTISEQSHAFRLSDPIIGFLVVSVVCHFLPAVSFAGLVMTLAAGCGPFAKIFAWKPLVQLSAISCSLYLLHFPILVYFKISNAELDPVFSLPLFAATIAFIFVCSALMFLLFEKPARTMINRSLDQFFHSRFPGKTPCRKPLDETISQKRSAHVSLASRSFGLLLTALALFFFIQDAVGEKKAQGDRAKVLTPAGALAAFKGALAAPVDISFEKKITLVCAQETVQNDKLLIRTLWRGSSITPPCSVAIHLLDANNTIVTNLGHTLLHRSPKDESLWSDSIEVKVESLRGIKHIGLAVVVDGKTLGADNIADLDSDWGRHRIFLPVSNPD